LPRIRICFVSPKLGDGKRRPYMLFIKKIMKISIFKIFITGLFFTAFAFCAAAVNETSRETNPQLEKQFQTPSDETSPWVFWMWLRTDSTFEAITKDLEAMSQTGIGGAILYESGNTALWYQNLKMQLEGKEYKRLETEETKIGYAVPVPMKTIPPWGDRQRKLFRHAAKEAARLNVKICMCIGLAGTSGDIPPEYGQQKLISSKVEIEEGKTFDGKFPDSQGNLIASLAVPKNKKVAAKNEIIDLTKNPSQKLNGSYTIYRFAYAPTGAKNVWGLYSDALSKEATDKCWDSTIGKLLAEMSPEERKGIYAVEDDSWESGGTSWTKNFLDDFKRLQKYEMTPYLPVLAGQTVESEAETAKFRRDYNRTLADLIAVNHYGRLRELANQNGLIFFSETTGPNTNQMDGMLNSGQVDVAMGEFWVPSPHRPTPPRRFMLRNAASANHIYGKKITPCEAFTSVGPHWEDTFFEMKNTADQAFCDGCNQCVIHCYSHSPVADAIPGYVYFAGTHYTRQTTWWNQTPAFNAYLSRCSMMLQQGLFVADALYYRGDAIGQLEQMKTRPSLPAEGYDHDNCNLDVLLNRLIVKDGKLILPDGMSYKMLIIPNDIALIPEAAQKLQTLQKDGATIVGKGFIEKNPQDVLKEQNILPDLEITGLSGNGDMDWIHRQTNDADIYFIASRWDSPESLTCTFRVSGKQPELWDPVTGEIRNAVAFQQSGGRTTLPLDFQNRESVFVVFRKPIAANINVSQTTNSLKYEPLQKLTGSWNVSFDAKLKGPKESVVFEQLTDWSKHESDAIKYYSGSAVYKKEFSFDASKLSSDVADFSSNASELSSSTARNTRLFLNLGDVREVASVKLNGIEIGTIWMKPSRIEITKALKQGKNELEITVTNLWTNRLIGDELLPPEDRITETNIHKFGKNTPLRPSGLLGEVVLEKCLE